MTQLSTPQYGTEAQPQQAVGFVRESTLGQAQRETPVAVQVDAIKAKADELGLVLTEIITLTASSTEAAQTPEWQRFDRLLTEDGPATGIVYHKDRLDISRDGVPRVDFLLRVRDAGSQVITCTGPGIAIDQEAGPLLEFIDAYVKRQQVDRARQGSRDGMRKRILTFGKPSSYHPVFGYDWAKEGNTDVLRPSDRWHVRKLITDLSLAGETDEGICRELEHRSIPSPSGQPKWTRSTVRNIQRDAVSGGRYHGFTKEMAAPRTRRPWSKSRRPKATTKDRAGGGVWMDHIIVERPCMTWEQREWLLEKRQERKERAARNRWHEYLLAGHVYCAIHHGENGHPRKFRGITHKGRSYMICPVPGCPNGYLRTDDKWNGLDTLVRKSIKEWFFQARGRGGLPEQEKTTETTRNRLLGETAGLKTEYEKRLQALSTLVAEYHAHLGESGVRDESRRMAIAKLETRANYITERQKEVESELAVLRQQKDITRTIDELSDYYWDRFDTMSVHEWRRLFDVLNLRLVAGKEVPEDPDLISNDSGENIMCRFMPGRKQPYMELTLGIPLDSSWLPTNTDQARDVVSIVHTASRRTEHNPHHVFPVRIAIVPPPRVPVTTRQMTRAP